MKAIAVLMTAVAMIAAPEVCLAQPSKPIAAYKVRTLARRQAVAAPAANDEQARRAQLVLTVLYLAGAAQQRGR